MIFDNMRKLFEGKEKAPQKSSPHPKKYDYTAFQYIAKADQQTASEETARQLPEEASENQGL